MVIGLDIDNVNAFKQGKALVIRMASMLPRYAEFVNEYVYVHEHEHEKIKS